MLAGKTQRSKLHATMSGVTAALPAPETPSVAQQTPGLGLCACHQFFAFWPSENAFEMTNFRVGLPTSELQVFSGAR